MRYKDAIPRLRRGSQSNSDSADISQNPPMIAARAAGVGRAAVAMMILIETR